MFIIVLCRCVCVCVDALMELMSSWHGMAWLNFIHTIINVLNFYHFGCMAKHKHARAHHFLHRLISLVASMHCKNNALHSLFWIVKAQVKCPYINLNNMQRTRDPRLSDSLISLLLLFWLFWLWLSSMECVLASYIQFSLFMTLPVCEWLFFFISIFAFALCVCFFLLLINTTLPQEPMFEHSLSGIKHDWIENEDCVFAIFIKSHSFKTQTTTKLISTNSYTEIISIIVTKLTNDSLIEAVDLKECACFVCVVVAIQWTIEMNYA